MSSRWTTEDLKAYEARRGVRIEIADDPKPSKYRNLKTEVDGIIFDSKKEASRYSELKMLQRSGAISGLTLQPEYDLIVNDEKIGVYRADFRYLERGAVVIEDVKSSATKTPVYRIKKKLVKAIYGISVVEV